MPKILIIINPKSGKPNAKTKIYNACDIFCAHGYDLGVYFTQAKGDAFRYVKEHGNDFDILLAVGGDGTINEVTNAAMALEKRPQIAYFPSGTMNDFGSNFSLTGNYEDIAERITAKNTRSFDLGYFDEERYFNYVAGFGAFTDVSYKTKRESKEALGSLAYLLEGLGTIPNMKATHTKIRVGKKKEELDVLFGLVFSGNRVAGLELFNRKHAMNDGSLNILLVEYAPNIFETANYLALLSQTDNRYLHWFNGSDIEFSFEEDIMWTIDGEEHHGSDHAHITVVKDALEMLC